MECQGATGGSSCGAGSWLANGQLADSWLANGAWLASGRGWPTDTVGLRSVVGLRKTGWPTDLCQARSNWQIGLEGARSFQKQLGRAGSCQEVLVGQRKFQGSLVGLRKFQKAPERASSTQNWPETARIAQKLPETGWPADSTKPSGSHRQLSHHVQNSLQGVKLPKSP
ncbi:uncharacterized protein LOC122722596 isoform X2 [Manihot esculenta]|uniref:uncharacterized protein LOC122722596 isoform X2 n=1 Tax=Manihot esculenta TaxID=3983 RepID=UPI001CC47457|nr:uncharacterized protein LOC122722596 isoform X2 [Manihot esculenta]